MKGLRQVQRAYRSKFKNRPCPAEAITKLSKKFDTTGKILDLPPKPKKERDIRVDARNKLKVLSSEDCRSEKQLMFHTVFAVIFFSKICNSNSTNTRVLINYCHLIIKKGNFFSMMAGLGKGCSQMVDRYWWSLILPNWVDQQAK